MSNFLTPLGALDVKGTTDVSVDDYLLVMDGTNKDLSAIKIDNILTAATAITDSTLTTSDYVLIQTSGNVLRKVTVEDLFDEGLGGVDQTDYMSFLGPGDIVINSVGTWTPTKIGVGETVTRHTAGDETNIMVFDITNEVRKTSARGFKLTSFDYICDIDTASMDAHTVKVLQVTYANSTAVAVTSVSISGTLTTTHDVSANPSLNTITISTPAFMTTTRRKMVIEVTQNFAGTTAFDFHGIFLHFTRNLGDT